MPDDGSGCGDDDQRFGDGGELFVVADEPSVLDDPGERPLHHPATGQDREARRRGVASNDLQGDVGLLRGPVDQATGIAAICEGMPHERVASARPLQHPLGAVAVLDVGAMDVDGEQATIGIGQDMALAAPDLLACVVASGTPF